jgi:hypothetical protein
MQLHDACKAEIAYRDIMLDTALATKPEAQRLCGNFHMPLA